MRATQQRQHLDPTLRSVESQEFEDLGRLALEAGDLHVALHYGVASNLSFLSDGHVLKQHHVLVNESPGANSDAIA